jgi:hypothetical protein
VADTVTPWSCHAALPNFLGPFDPPALAYTHAEHARLARIKAKHDPSGLFGAVTR